MWWIKESVMSRSQEFRHWFGDEGDVAYRAAGSMLTQGSEAEGGADGNHRYPHQRGEEREQ